MNAIKQIARIACAAAVAGTATWTVARAQDAPPGNAGIGQRLFIADGCYTCHGRSGQGGAYNGPAPILAKTALPFDGFKAQIRNPVNDMPAFPAALLSDKDIADIYAFVRSLPGPRSTKDIAILNY